MLLFSPNIKPYAGSRFTPSSTDVYQCPSSPNCRGGTINGNKSATEALCRYGAMGPLCTVCFQEYFLSAMDGCQECSMGNAWLAPLMCVFLVCILFAIFRNYERRLKRIYERNTDHFHELMARCTVVFVTMQVIFCNVSVRCTRIGPARDK